MDESLHAAGDAGKYAIGRLDIQEDYALHFIELLDVLDTILTKVLPSQVLLLILLLHAVQASY